MYNVHIIVYIIYYSDINTTMYNVHIIVYIIYYSDITTTMYNIHIIVYNTLAVLKTLRPLVMHLAHSQLV